MVQASRPRLNRHVPLWGGGGAGLIVAVVAAIVPADLLEAVTESSGIAAVLPVAAPPLGVTARAVLALGGGIGVAAVVWAALYLLVGPGGPLARTAGTKPIAGRAPTVRRADAHPDAPPRWPLSMSELPVPAAPDAAAAIEAVDVPRDLDVPLAAFDPDALLPVPMEPARSVRPLAVLAPGERLETYTLAPPPPPAPAPRPVPASTPSEPPSIDALLRRLEQGARRRAAAAH